MNEWHNEDKGAINKKIITLIVMLAAATSLAILFAFQCFTSQSQAIPWLVELSCMVVVS
jgi:sterol desaturase/sphingolipid hydroxylase (fatty acid hydroxylase superfamily)